MSEVHHRMEAAVFIPGAREREGKGNERERKGREKERERERGV